MFYKKNEATKRFLQIVTRNYEKIIIESLELIQTSENSFIK